ncbi:MAG TPA: hypothetical protein VEF53_18725 [Patescibacteria group bacterium]|nr:hypothetical protein [Patescibacteria group bacterium]
MELVKEIPKQYEIKVTHEEMECMLNVLNNSLKPFNHDNDAEKIVRGMVNKMNAILNK